MKIKEHIKEHKDAYIAGATCGVVFAGITTLIMRRRFQPISDGIVADATKGGIVAVLGKKAEMNNVSFISSYRKGPPSWIVRCLETGEIWSSQKKAALSLDIPQNELSQHLNGLRDSVHGRTFERIAMTA